MACLIEIIRSLPLTRVALISNEYRYTYGDVAGIYQDNTSTIDLAKNTCVAIKGRSRDEFALLVILLDGSAKRIVFLPSDIDESLIEQYYTDSEVDYEAYLDGGALRLNFVRPVQPESGERVTEWVIPTSGTTSIPKLVAHTLESLTRTAKSNVEVGKNFVWGLVFDIYRFSGIQVFLQSILGGSSLLIANADMNMGESLAFFAKNNCNVISATPSFWRKALMSPQLNQLALTSVTLGGEIADESILLALRSKFPQASIRHIYASTEVGVGFSVTDGHAGFPLDYIEKGVNGIELKINPEGLLLINPTNRSQKYIGSNVMFDSDGFINTGDLVEIVNGRVYFLGRESGAINVGGNKVQPEEVERVLLKSGIVQCAFVYAKKNPMMGNLVCADVVLADDFDGDTSLAKATILSYCRAHLDSFKVPAIIKFVEDLNTTQSGKLKRN